MNFHILEKLFLVKNGTILTPRRADSEITIKRNSQNTFSESKIRVKFNEKWNFLYVNWRIDTWNRCILVRITRIWHLKIRVPERMGLVIYGSSHFYKSGNKIFLHPTRKFFSPRVEESSGSRFQLENLKKSRFPSKFTLLGLRT